MPSPVSKEMRAQLQEKVLTIECPRCGAKAGEPCIYKNRSRARRFKTTVHDVRFIEVTRKNAKKPPTSRYGLVQGHNTEDLRPIADRQLTLREMRDAGIWVPLKEEKSP